MECSICTEKFNKTTRKLTHCPTCQAEFCILCIQKNVIAKNTPCCLSCNKEYDYTFLSSILPRKFMDTEYKEYKKNKLVDAQMVLLPETMYLVEIIRETERLKNMIKGLVEQKTLIQDEINRAKDKLTPLEKELQHPTPVEYVQTSAGPCSTLACRGFINGETYACAVCNATFCKECREYTHKGECKQEHLLSAKMIADDSKPCPNCSVFIFKIEGCDQMWCSQCKTPFSWNTGLIEKGQIHNPHYYEWRFNNVECDNNVYENFPSLNIIESIACKLSLQEQLFIYSTHRTIIHIDQVDITNLNEQIHNNKNLRLDYLLGKYTKDQMADLLYDQDIIAEKNKSIVDCLILYRDTVLDLFRQFIVSKSISSFSTEPALREYVNTHLTTLEKTYGVKLGKYKIKSTPYSV